MKKSTRILALTAAVLMALLYISTLILALIDYPVAQDLLKASIAATILLPVLLYAYILIYRLNQRHDDDSTEM